MQYPKLICVQQLGPPAENAALWGAVKKETQGLLRLEKSDPAELHPDGKRL